MSALEQMRPFFRFCQFVGFFPISYGNRQANWEISKVFILVAKLGYLVVYITLALSPFIVIGTSINVPQQSAKLPITVTMSVMGSDITYSLLLFSARFWMTLCFTALRRAIVQIHIIEQSLMDYPVPDCRCTIKIRIFVGLILSIV